MRVHGYVWKYLMVCECVSIRLDVRGQVRMCRGKEKRKEIERRKNGTRK
jgi:hypothetical protein